MIVGIPASAARHAHERSSPAKVAAPDAGGGNNPSPVNAGCILEFAMQPRKPELLIRMGVDGLSAAVSATALAASGGCGWRAHCDSQGRPAAQERSADHGRLPGAARRAA